jgi:hypothetical protein
MKSKPSFEDITVVVMHGNGGVDKEVPSLIKSSAALPGSKQLIITNKLIDTDIPQKLVHSTLNYMDIQDFMVYGLGGYIETDYALIVQSDGWVLNADNWRDEFFDYDYIGGATHAALEGNNYYMWYSWIGKTTNPWVVQNGGFSLRSKKLLDAPVKYGITKKYQENTMLYNEDIQLCCWMRPDLEKVGLKFAPTELSMYFSFEHLHPVLHKDLDLMKVFGHHSRFRRLESDKRMRWLLSDKEMAQLACEDRVYKMFQDYGYDIIKAEK